MPTTEEAPVLLVEAQAAPGQPFRPSAHAFRFRNAFPGVKLPLTLPGSRSKAASIYGLCGGMCFAAVDYMRAGQPVPTAPQVPADGTPLHLYLIKRQLESLGAGYRHALRFLTWMFLPEGTRIGVRRRTYNELQLIRAMLGAGSPVVLGLLYVSGWDSLAIWKNHQVLAYRVEQPTPDVTRLFVYDPNFPTKDDVFIRLEREIVAGAGQETPVYGVSATQVIAGAPDKAVRGLFVIPYSPSKPPGE